MSTTFIILSIATALWIGFSGFSIFNKSEFVVKPLADYGVPRSWWPWLGAAKTAGAIGLLAGLAVPVIGIAAAGGLVLYFIGAVITVLRARSYKTLAFPVLYLAPAAATLVLAIN